MEVIAIAAEGEDMKPAEALVLHDDEEKGGGVGSDDTAKLAVDKEPVGLVVLVMACLAMLMDGWKEGGGEGRLKEDAIRWRWRGW